MTKPIEFKIPVSFGLNRLQRQYAMKAINMAILGRETCNIFNPEGNIIPDPSIDPETDKHLLDAQQRIVRGQEITITATLNPFTGALTISL